MTKNTEQFIHFNWPEVAALLFKARGITSGLWRVGVNFRFAAINAGPSDLELFLPDS